MRSRPGVRNAHRRESSGAAGRPPRAGGPRVRGRPCGLHSRRTILRLEHGDRPRDPGEVLFSSRGGAAVAANRAGPADAFTRDPPLGRAIMALAREHAPSQHIYIAGEGIGPGRREVFLRLFWNDARRLEYLRDTRVRHRARRDWSPPVRSAARAEGRGAAQAARARRPAGPSCHRRGRRGRLGSRTPAPAQATAAATLPMPFYPVDRIQSRLASAVAVHRARRSSAPVERGSLGPAAGIGRRSCRYPDAGRAGLTVHGQRPGGRAGADAVRFRLPRVPPAQDAAVAAQRGHRNVADGACALAREAGAVSRHHPQTKTTRLSALVQRILEFSRLQQPRGYEFETSTSARWRARRWRRSSRACPSRSSSFRVEEQARPRPSAPTRQRSSRSLVNLLDNAVKYSARVVKRSSFACARRRRRRSSKSSTAASASARPTIGGFSRSSIAGPGRRCIATGSASACPSCSSSCTRTAAVMEVESAPGQGATFRVILPPKAIATVMRLRPRAEPANAEAVT